MVAQRPMARGDIAVVTGAQLLESSPVRLASTSALESDLVSIHAAREMGADLLLQGEIMAARIELEPEQELPADANMNEVFFQRKGPTKKRDESLLLSWRVIDVATSQTVDASAFTLRTRDVLKRYPDLQLLESDPPQMLIAASARESWKSVAPYLQRERVRLASPWLQPGSFFVRRGVSAARKGQWELAEQRWTTATRWFPFNGAAHHNLAVSYAAREDFPAAKRELLKAKGPLAARVPTETLYWLDVHHREYNRAHGLGTPAEGWAFPEPERDVDDVAPVAPISLSELPWWTAIPLVKPPGWSWRAWLSQPWVF